MNFCGGTFKQYVTATHVTVRDGLLQQRCVHDSNLYCYVFIFLKTFKIWVRWSQIKYKWIGVCINFFIVRIIYVCHCIQLIQHTQQ